MYIGDDIESQTPMVEQFLSNFYTSSRQSVLITKVYALVSLQLFCTFIAVLPMYLHKHYVETHTMEFFWPSVILSFVFLGLMFVAKGVPKLFLSLAYSCCNGVMIGSAIVRYNIDVLMQAVIITLFTTISCALFTYFTRINLHTFGGILYTCLMCTIIASCVFIFLPVSSLIHMIYCIFGIILFVLYILYDTSELRNGSYSHDEDSYIIIAVNLYLDIINLFLYILEFLDINDD
jgi:protein lifeguard